MSTNTLIRCHANAFRYLGGSEEILYDNMKQAIIAESQAIPFAVLSVSMSSVLKCGERIMHHGRQPWCIVSNSVRYAIKPPKS